MKDELEEYKKRNEYMEKRVKKFETAGVVVNQTYSDEDSRSVSDHEVSVEPESANKIFTPNSKISKFAPMHDKNKDTKDLLSVMDTLNI